jgi:hypothetical protein
MKHKKRAILFLIALIFLVSCQAPAPEDHLEPTLETFSLAIIPELTHWLPVVAQCANTLPNFAIITQITPQPGVHASDADLILRLGERTEADPYVTVLGYEEIVVVAGREVPVASLSLESLQAIFTGNLTEWGQIAEIETEETDEDQPIQVLSYPEGNPLRALFIETYLDKQPMLEDTSIFSTLDTLKNLLEMNPTAIGYLLASQVSSGMQTLAITDIDPQSTQHYVLAITAAEPQGALRQILLCVQDED